MKSAIHNLLFFTSQYGTPSSIFTDKGYQFATKTLTQTLGDNCNHFTIA